MTKKGVCLRLPTFVKTFSKSGACTIKHFITAIITIEQHVLDTNEGKQLS